MKRIGVKRQCGILFALMVLVFLTSCRGDSKQRSRTGEAAARPVIQYPQDPKQAILYNAILQKPSLQNCQDYLDNYRFQSQHQHRAIVLEKMEPLLYESVKIHQTIDVYKKYLSYYPNHSRSGEIRTALDPLLYEFAKASDRCSAYEEYLRYCPNGTNTENARNRMLKLKAILALEYPKEVDQRENAGPFWEWETVVREIGGNIGCRVMGMGYILDREGNRWPSFYRGHLSLAASEVGSDNFWIRSSEHVFCNGFAIITWSGEDTQGNKISKEVRVLLRHTHCPKLGQRIKVDLPAFKNRLIGTHEVTVENPNKCEVEAGLRRGEDGINWTIPANGVSSVLVPNGRFDIYFR